MAPHRPDDGLPDVIDIRRGEIEFHLLDDVKRGLQSPDGGQKSLPPMIFYDDKGLRLFEDITYLDEYYPTNTEIEVLESNADQIAQKIPQGAQVVELGSGNLRKVQILLDALEKAAKDVDYYALDLSLAELYRTLGEVPVGEYNHVKCHGLHGTYDDGFEWLRAPENAGRPKCVLSLGSSIGNFDRAEAADFLGQISKSLNPNDTLLIAVDGCQDPSRVYHAYNDRHGTTHKFYRNGLDQINRLLGKPLFQHDDWDIIGEFNAEHCRHQAFISPRKDIIWNGIRIARGERIHIENSHKYPTVRMTKLRSDAGLVLNVGFTNARGDYHISMLSPGLPPFALDPRDYASSPAPTLEEFEQLWAAWDLVSHGLIPHYELLSRPINLRNCCLFYLGHLPNFLDIHISKATDGVPTEPASYRDIFERGIDPDVENPALCHTHSETPASWPEPKEIFAYQKRVYDRIRALYQGDEPILDARVAYALWIGFEHQAMHLETFLYMLLQSDKALPPPGPKPDFEALALEASTRARPNSWIKVPEQEIKFGMKPSEKESTTDFLGWDAEMPVRRTKVPAFEAQARPLTNRDYACYLSEAGINSFPASWAVSAATTNGHQNGSARTTSVEQNDLDQFLQDKTVKTLYGPVPLALALDWPVVASYDELASCAKWMGGRIPTAEEAHSIYAYVEELHGKDISFQSPQNIPAVNGHLSNNGVEESPPQANGHKSPGTENGTTTGSSALFANLQGCNVGFKAFHPVPITQHGDALVGRAGMGGVWEWTSSVLERWEGFKPMDAYPLYTVDFFDGKHNILLGGSWATHPRIAGRKSFVNWFQRNYPYAWGGARVVRDL